MLQLVIWREARGESNEGKRAVGHVCQNRTFAPYWWNGHHAFSYKSVILQPWQFSSFNPSDPNSNRWPENDDPSFADCCAVALGIAGGSDYDNTDGSTHYFDVSLPEFPKGWGDPAKYYHTVDIGRLKFYRYIG